MAGIEKKRGGGGGHMVPFHVKINSIRFINKCCYEG